MYFNANLSVTINGRKLTSVVGVRTANDAAQMGATCELIVPLNSYIEYQDPSTLQTYLSAVRVDTFPQGCPVEIKASYDGYPELTVFKGFVYDFVLGMPTSIKCLDYIYFFNLGVFGEQRLIQKNKKGKIKNQGKGVNYKSIKFKDLLQQLIDFTNKTIELTTETTGAQPVTLMLPTIDMTLQNLTFIAMSPASILDWLKKELGLNITFYDNKLYVNLASKTNGQITLDTGVNVIKSNLQTTFQGSIIQNGSPSSLSYQTAFQKIRLKCWFLREDGTRDSFEIGDQNGIQEEHFFYKVKRSETIYEDLANAALLKTQQHHYRGELELLLYPDCDLFYEVFYTDRRYPERNGVYVILGVYIELSEKGFRRKIKVAWLTPITYRNAQGQVVTS
jgi:hypothetical protein